MSDLRSLLAEYDRQCVARPVFDATGQWVRDRNLLTPEAAAALEDAIAARAAELGITATELRVRLRTGQERP